MSDDKPNGERKEGRHIEYTIGRIVRASWSMLSMGSSSPRAGQSGSGHLKVASMRCFCRAYLSKKMSSTSTSENFHRFRM